tara:strand:+ start:5476 stop:6756 length:1281 start_codon:yes stop_codon:yes gene_type:complete
MNIKNLHNKFLQCNSIIDIDSRSIRKGSMFFAIKGENFDGNNFAIEALKKGAGVAIIDSNQKKFENIDNVIKVENSLKALQKLANYHRNKTKSKIIALTGSNGKTTSKELIHLVLKEKFNTISTLGNFNNHIGVPLSLLQIKEDTEFSIIELGANNFGEIDFLTRIVEPDYGYITNFGKAHLEGFKNLKGVVKGKTELYNWIIENDKTLILNNDDLEQIKFNNYKKISFGSKTKSNYNFEYIPEKKVVVKCSEKIYESNIYGDYNFSNICVAISIGLHFGVDSKKIQKSLINYKLENNRSQIIKTKSKEIILDAYNANPTSMAHAIESFSKINGSKAVILGDMFELGSNAFYEHKRIVDIIKNNKIDKSYFIGIDFFNAKDNSESLFFYKTKENFYDDVKEINEEQILVKGSRGMKMEEIINKKLK